jgi:hypothetical protein
VRAYAHDGQNFVYHQQFRVNADRHTGACVSIVSFFFERTSTARADWSWVAGSFPTPLLSFQSYRQRRMRGEVYIYIQHMHMLLMNSQAKTHIKVCKILFIKMHIALSFSDPLVFTIHLTPTPRSPPRFLLLLSPVQDMTHANCHKRIMAYILEPSCQVCCINLSRSVVEKSTSSSSSTRTVRAWGTWQPNPAPPS